MNWDAVLTLLVLAGLKLVERRMDERRQARGGERPGDPG